MKKRKPNPKKETLRERGCLHPHPEDVSDDLFASSEFFDSQDLVQVKYEMLRRVRIDGRKIAPTAGAFGLSRPSFYQAQAAFARGGFAELIPKKPGPRRAHKLSDDVVAMLLDALEKQSDLSSVELADFVEEHCGFVVHPRSVERALQRQKKKTAAVDKSPRTRLEAISSVCLQTYEELRDRAFKTERVTNGSRLGLAVLLNSGVATWMEKWLVYNAPQHPTRVAKTTPLAPLPDDERRDIINILSSTILNHLQENQA